MSTLPSAGSITPADPPLPAEAATPNARKLAAERRKREIARELASVREDLVVRDGVMVAVFLPILPGDDVATVNVYDTEAGTENKVVLSLDGYRAFALKMAQTIGAAK